jgi:hypothetical protein
MRNGDVPHTQGALRDPGLWNATPSRLNCFNRLNIMRGLSLIEVVASTLIVGLMAVAALNSLGAATRSSNSIGNRAVALGLADDLMTEILQLPYSDPNQTPVHGPESGEAAVFKYLFDDVDDYNNWSEQPPRTKNWRGTYSATTPYVTGDLVEYLGLSYLCTQANTGNATSNTSYWQATSQIADDRSDWRRLVTVARVGPNDPTQTSGSDLGAKRIRVIVEYRSQVLAELVAVRTNIDK